MPQSWARRRPSWERPNAGEPGMQAPVAPVPFFSSVQRSYESEWETNRRNARWERTQDELWARHRDAERRAGRRLPQSRALASVSPGGEEQSFLDRWLFDPEAINARLMGRSLLEEDAYEAMLDAERTKAPQAWTGFETRDALRSRLDTDFRQTRARADEASASGLEGGAGGFVGTIGAVMSDPANAVTSVVGGGIGAGKPLLSRMLIQGGLGAGQEALDVGNRFSDAENYGGPQYTAGQALGDIGFGAAGGAGFEALGSGAAATWRAAARRLEASPDPASRGLSAQIERLLEDEDAIGSGTMDFDGDRAALARGDLPAQNPPDRDLEALFADQPATVRNPMQPGPAAPMDGPMRAAPGITAETEYQGRPIFSGRFDPLAVDADPQRFQYKADGDAEGVTGRLRGVERWDATASGKAIIWEDPTGRLIVADGHQRRGLARRLAEQGWEDAQLDGYLFRASDGWSAGDVRVVAALKNIREGSGSVLDAAKVFREAPRALDDRSLPVTGDFIQSARQLAGLSDDAFRAVINGVIPERYGAVIGEQAAGKPELHGDLVELLRRGDPRSIEGARALIQEGMLDDFLKGEGQQMDLFGGLPRESTVIARGRIREAVLGALRRDEKLNSALVRNADAIEAGGNVLARTDNEARLAVDRAASELVSRLALRSGDMGQAFSDAAAAVTKGEVTPGVAAKGLVQRIRAAVAAGERLDEVRAEVIDPSPPSAAALREVEAFDTPGGAAQRAQLTPKPEDAALEAEPRPMVARLIGDELGDATDWADMGRAARAVLDRLRGQSIRSEALGREVQITKAGISKATRAASTDVMRALPAIADILRQGRLLASEPDRYGRPNVRAVHTLGADVEIDGQRLSVVAKVREDDKGDIWWGLFEDDGRLDSDGVQRSAIRRVGSDAAPGGDRTPNIGETGDELNLTVEAAEPAPPPGLFDDLPTTTAEDRALSVLKACAPGKGT